MSDKERKPKGKPEPKPAGTRPGARADDLAFEHIIEAILDADPEALQANRGAREKRKARSLRK